MSSEAVRAAVRASWPVLLPGVRYIDTINRSLPYNPPLPLPDIWGTLGFDSLSRLHQTMGANPWIEERGVVSIFFIAKSGHGDSLAIQTATAAIAAWEGWEDATKQIWFTSVGAPRQVDPEANGDWFLVVLTCTYVAQGRSLLP